MVYSVELASGLGMGYNEDKKVRSMQPGKGRLENPV